MTSVAPFRAKRILSALFPGVARETRLTQVGGQWAVGRGRTEPSLTVGLLPRTDSLPTAHCLLLTPCRYGFLTFAFSAAMTLAA